MIACTLVHNYALKFLSAVQENTLEKASYHNTDRKQKNMKLVTKKDVISLMESK